MITADNDLIEQIVANVLAELQPAPSLPVRAPTSIASLPPASSLPPSVASRVELDIPVITAVVLAEKIQPGQSLQISRKSILTPSARDWLQARKISWSRSHQNLSHRTDGAARWQLLLTAMTPALATLRSSLTDWKTDLLGTPKEAAEQAIRLLCTGESDGVLALCGASDTVACLANRNPKVRAAVLTSVAGLSSLVEQLQPNLLVVDPRSRSFTELKHMLQAVRSLQRPSERHPWDGN